MTCLSEPRAAAAVLLSALLCGSAPCAVWAEPATPSGLGPDPVDLGFHFQCSEAAERRVLSLDEAAACSQAFLRIKLSFVPDVGIDRFQALPTEERAAINLVAYQRYRAWYDENSAAIEAMKDSMPYASTLAEK